RLEAIKDASSKEKKSLLDLRSSNFTTPLAQKLQSKLLWYLWSYYRAKVGGTLGVGFGLGNVSPLEWICYRFNENSPQSKILWSHT
ncbi:MAG: hypothetical protein N2Z40_01055, partial [Caldimicrobium sp.]|nr:hypothetical protein [Caldimicrobium sp.]